MTIFSSVLLVAVFTAIVHAAPASIWHVSIWEGPAPPPDLGPPASAHALRDKSKLKYEVVGIVGAYVVWAAVTGIVILCISKPLRRKAQTSLRTLNMEIIQPPTNQPELGIGPGPMSPRKPWTSPATTAVNSWKSPEMGHGYKSSNVSVSTCHESVVEQDKARNMDEMERLYAAVMAHEAKKSPSPQSPGFDQRSLKSPTHAPPELQHLREETPAVRALGHPLAPSPVEEETRSAAGSRASSKMTKAVSFFSSGSRASSANSTKSRPSHISIRGLPISQPVPSPGPKSATFREEQALSARIYSPGPPPVAPHQMSAAAQARESEKPARTKPTAVNSSRSLPFREAYESMPQSAPPTKVTYLEKRDSVIRPAPKTGVPQTPYTPYTPYQPFTPMTPITPGRLVTKEERKRMKKQEGKKVLSDDDLVKSDEEMWQ